MLNLANAAKGLLGSAMVFCIISLCALLTTAQDNLALYKQIKAFSLTGGKADVNALVLKRDRCAMVFSGTFYFSASINGKVTGAVFIGLGKFRADVPPSDFEKANVKRLLGVENVVESDFTTAVLKFTDDTFALIGNERSEGAATAAAQTLASDIDNRILKETGANLSARLTLSIVNKESPGFFFGSFSGGKQGTFSYVFDYQKRIPTAHFGINGGERGLIFAYKYEIQGNDVWLAFFSQSDYERQVVSYSDYDDLVDIRHYDMAIDVTDPKNKLGLKTLARMISRTDGLRAITFSLGEGLGEDYDVRLRKQMRMTSVRSGDVNLDFIQEDWEAGFTVFLPKEINAGDSFSLDFDLAGDFLTQPDGRLLQSSSYPLSNTTWYPRHGYLDRSTFSFVFRHNKKLKIACVGTRSFEGPADDDKEQMITKYELAQPVAFVTFALGEFSRYTQQVKWDNSNDSPITLEFNSLDFLEINEELILAELNNSIRYFHEMFGRYPYDTFSGTYHPYGFGQGFPTMLMIPATNNDTKSTFSFLAHETSHQWWGNLVTWRSYRDQWLSEGFAEYSGVLYTNLRKNPGEGKKLIEEMRASLIRPLPFSKGRLVDVGPLIMGHRVSTRKTAGAYQALIYNKGGLVLRMIHFLMTDANGDGKPFFDMMKDFVETYRDKAASSDDFRKIANRHFAKTIIAQRYNLTDLDWFFQQFVYQTELPSYHLDYKFESQPDGTITMTGNVTQTGGGETWFMPLPVEFTFSGKRNATGTVFAKGTKAPFIIKLPSRPEKVEFDPYLWIMSKRTTSN